MSWNGTRQRPPQRSSTTRSLHATPAPRLFFSPSYGRENHPRPKPDPPEPILSSAVTMTTNLPTAIQMLRDVLAADRGQARADSLLAILGAGLDYVRQHVTVLDAALGTFSPGVSGLDELIRKAEEVVSTSQPTVKRQHVISEVVLRRFAGPVPSAGRQLVRFDLAAGQGALAKAKDVGYIE